MSEKETTTPLTQAEIDNAAEILREAFQLERNKHAGDGFSMLATELRKAERRGFERAKSIVQSYDNSYRQDGEEDWTCVTETILSEMTDKNDYASNIVTACIEAFGMHPLFQSSTKTEAALIEMVRQEVRTSPEFAALIEAADNVFTPNTYEILSDKSIGDDMPVFGRGNTLFLIGDLRALAAAVKALKGGEG